jgi:hypothetical protein
MQAARIGKSSAILREGTHMKVKLWLAGAVSMAAVTLGFGTTASATVHHPAPRVPWFFAGAHPRPGVSPNTTYFGNWAGYVALGDKNVSLRYVAADFNIPSLNCTGAQANATVLQFVGLQGWSATGELTGIQGACNSDGTSSYQGFYDIGSTGGVSSGTINPGDAIQASVYYNTTTKQFTFYLDDVTQQVALLNTPVSCPSGSSCTTGTAEAVTDDPFDVTTKVNFPLANYGMENFTGGAVTSADGVKGGFGSSKLWVGAESVIRDSSGITQANPSSLEGGVAFNTTWRFAS